MQNNEQRHILNSIALDIEFLLISVIQGMALQILASNATAAAGTFQIEYWGYIVSAFLLILIFWSQSIAHALSFIDWPIDIGHTFIYLLASFIEVITFAQITNPLRWFVFGLIFLLIAAILYIYDLTMIQRHKNDFATHPTLKRLYDHMYTRQIREMTRILPAALLFNIFASVLIYVYPDIFIDQKYHVVFSMIQVIFSIILLGISVKTFNDRSRLITDAYLRS